MPRRKHNQNKVDSLLDSAALSVPLGLHYVTFRLFTANDLRWAREPGATAHASASCGVERRCTDRKLPWAFHGADEFLRRARDYRSGFFQTRRDRNRPLHSWSQALCATGVRGTGYSAARRDREQPRTLRPP